MHYCRTAHAGNSEGMMGFLQSQPVHFSARKNGTTKDTKRTQKSPFRVFRVFCGHQPNSFRKTKTPNELGASSPSPHRRHLQLLPHLQPRRILDSIQRRRQFLLHLHFTCPGSANFFAIFSSVSPDATTYTVAAFFTGASIVFASSIPVALPAVAPPG